MIRVTFLISLLWGLAASPLSAQEDRFEERGMERCYIAGVPRLGWCTYLDAPLDYNNPSQASIKLHVAILPATGSVPREDPVVLLAGGPGQAAGELGRLASVIFADATRKRDILLIDARGTGKSTPLDCTPKDIEGYISPEEMADYVAQCRGKFDFDVRHINLETITRDLDLARDFLGYEQLNLWGGSYGTRVAAHYIRRFEDRVRSAILDGNLPPTEALFGSVAQSAERAKDLLLADCSASEACAQRFPELEAKLNTLIDRAQRGELVYQGPDPLSGKPVVVPIGFVELVEGVRTLLYLADGTVMVPLVINETANGNLKPLLASISSVGAGGDFYLGMTLSVLCGEEFDRLEEGKVASASEGSFTGASFYDFWGNYCRRWDYFTVGKELPADIYEPLASNVPALVLSGELDPVTPPSLGEAMTEQLPNSRHISVPGTGHLTSYVGCMPNLIAQFLEVPDAKALDAECAMHLERLPMVTGINGQVW